MNQSQQEQQIPEFSEDDTSDRIDLCALRDNLLATLLSSLSTDLLNWLNEWLTEYRAKGFAILYNIILSIITLIVFVNQALPNLGWIMEALFISQINMTSMIIIPLMIMTPNIVSGRYSAVYYQKLPRFILGI